MEMTFIDLSLSLNQEVKDENLRIGNRSRLPLHAPVQEEEKLACISVN